LLVVLFHGLPKGSGRLDAWPSFAQAIISHGFVGVSFFFVLSGFILAYSYSGMMHGRKVRKSFWLARCARILPAYFFAFFVYLPIAIYAILAAEQPLDAALNAILIALFHLTLTQAWIPGAALAWNSPAWSLSVEAFFYLLFPSLLPKIESLSTRGILLIAIAAYAASQILAFAVGEVGSAVLATAMNDFSNSGPLGVEASSLFYMYFPIFRLPEFIFGAALGLIFVRQPPITAQMRRALLLLGSLGFLFGFLFLERHVPPAAISNGLLMPFLGLILFGLARSQSKVWNNAIFVRLGDASYSLYLLHIPLLLWLNTIDKKTFQFQERAFPAFFALYLATAVIISLVSLSYVERPGRLFIKRCFAHDAS
jgi:peptidoglycan/LPS O-acetylase OafA/YrhL